MQRASESERDVIHVIHIETNLYRMSLGGNVLCAPAI